MSLRRLKKYKFVATVFVTVPIEVEAENKYEARNQALLARDFLPLDEWELALKEAILDKGNGELTYESEE